MAPSTASLCRISAGSVPEGQCSGIYTTDGKVSINTKENKAFLEKMRDFYKGGYSVSGMDETAARESFESGQSAMVIVGPWEDQASTDKASTTTCSRFRTATAPMCTRTAPRLQHRLHRSVLVGHLPGWRLR